MSKRTQTEIMARHKQRRSGILVPMLEDLLLRPVNIEDQSDVDFIHDLLTRMVGREDRRRGEEKVFSPSSLSACVRKVYLLKNHPKLDIPKVYLPRIEPNFYFLTGNFLHIKWQFALYKMHKRIADPDTFELVAVEYPVISKHGDHGGTIDVIARIECEPFVIDVKGLNVKTFGAITRGMTPVDYEIQTVDYMMLYNAQRKKPEGFPSKISKAILLTENKGGPTAPHPAALAESVIEIATYLPAVRERLEVLREHEKEDEIPRPECISTRGLQFQGCPFAGFCKKEVREIENRRKQRSASSHADGFRLATPARRRTNRPGRNSK